MSSRMYTGPCIWRVSGGFSALYASLTALISWFSWTAGWWSDDWIGRGFASENKGTLSVSGLVASDSTLKAVFVYKSQVQFGIQFFHIYPHFYSQAKWIGWEEKSQTWNKLAGTLTVEGAFFKFLLERIYLHCHITSSWHVPYCLVTIQSQWPFSRSLYFINPTKSCFVWPTWSISEREVGSNARFLTKNEIYWRI